MECGCEWELERESFVGKSDWKSCWWKRSSMGEVAGTGGLGGVCGLDGATEGGAEAGGRGESSG